MTRSANSASRLPAALSAIGLAALLGITLASPGATRMYAWPWSFVYAVALLVPALWLVLRAFDSRRPLTLPGRAWTLTILALVGVVLGSALASPWRGPALLWSAPLLAPLAGFFLVFDWIQGDFATRRRSQLLTAAGLVFAVVAAVSVGLWLAAVLRFPNRDVWNARNPYPLGHSNYTAGLALLMLPLFVALAVRDRGPRRSGWLVGTVLAAVMLLTSGSRGGLVGLAVLVVLHLPAIARQMRLNLGWVVGGGVVLLGAFLAVNPRTRTMISGAEARATLQASDVQRSAMLHGGLALGRERPWLGWGPGTTPLAYPHVRRQLDGGVENVLQLHSLPLQLWAELGAAGVLGFFILLGLAVAAGCASPDARRVLLALSGYAVFSLTDWQLDVPVFAFTLAAAAALIAPTGGTSTRRGRVVVALVTLAALVLIGVFGRPDPTPALNVRALALARDPAQAGAAIALLEQSLVGNPDQEIAHFNLGWLLVVRNPAAAEQHFLAAAQLVPDKGGVYFGLGLAGLNQGRRADAVHAFALECVNDPVFLTSPWWRDPAVAPLRGAVTTLALQMLATIPTARTGENPSTAREAGYLIALIHWLEGQATPAQVQAVADTPMRALFFSRNLGSSPAPSASDFMAGPSRLYRRERTGYPVLMRNLDLVAPLDLFEVQENLLATGDLRFLFPPKGWLPAPLLLRLPDARHPTPAP